MDEKLRVYSRSRSAIYHEYRRLQKALVQLFESGVISEADLKDQRGRVDALYRSKKLEREQQKPVGMRSAGRPRMGVTERGACKRRGCGRSCAPGFLYCSREHAPLGFYGETSQSMGGE